MHDDNYFVVKGWMANKLNLSGAQLFAYAIIYGLSQDGVTEYKGSYKYIMEAINCSKNTAITAIKELTEKGYIEKRTIVINGVTFNLYKVNRAYIPKIGTPYQNLDDGIPEIGTPPIPEIGTSNNIYRNIKGNKNKEIYKSSLNSDLYKESQEEPTLNSFNEKAKEKGMSADIGIRTCPRNNDEQTTNVYHEVQNSYNTICTSLPRCTLISDKRKKAINAILGQFSMEQVTEALKKVQASDFLSGRSGAWQCSFDWLMITGNMLKVIEGNYDNKKNSRSDLGEREFTLTSREAKLSTDREFVLR